MRCPRRRQRQRRSRRVARLILIGTGRLLLPCALLAVTATTPLAGRTFARIGDGHFGGGVQMRALSADALALSTADLDLGPLTAGAPVSVPVALRVQNTSNRALPLSASLTGALGLTAGVSPQWLEPRASAVVWIAGLAPDPGDLTASLRISAYGEFLTAAVTIRGQVQAPPAPAPAPSDTGPKPEDDGRTQG